MVDILAMGAHTDDVDFLCGGILAKMAKQGRSIVIVDLTNCDKGTNGTSEERRQEGIAAAKLIGAERVFLGIPDCELMDTYENRLKLVRVIREYRPKLVLAQMWKGEQTHPDHIACGLLARYASRFAGYQNILPELPKHHIDGILHYPVHSVQNPDILIDISEEVETWKEMMACHNSQMKTFDYIEWNLRIASGLGVTARTAYAQALVHGNPLIVDDLMTISRGVRGI